MASHLPTEVDPEVVRLARGGDADAFVSLFHHYEGGLRRLVYRLLGDRDGMEDVLQEACMRAFRGVAGFRGDAAVGTWLYRITYNACVDELERRSTRSVLPLDELTTAASTPDPWDEVSRRSALAGALNQLAPADRAAVLLVDAEGFDYAAAAEILGVPEGMVASRLNRARVLLRANLGLASEGGGGT